MHTQDPTRYASTLMDLAAGHRVTAVLYVSAKLGIVDLIAEGPKTAAELARLTDTHERSLLRLMRALIALNVARENAEAKFETTELGGLLAAKSERSMKAWILVEGERLRVGWGQLIESIRTGKTNDELAGLGQDVFEVMAETKGASLFNKGMASITRGIVPAVRGG